MTINEFNQKHADLEYIYISADEITECPDLASHEGEYLLIGQQFADLKYSQEMVQELTDHINNASKGDLCDLYNLVFNRKFSYMDDQDQDTLYKEVK